MAGRASWTTLLWLLTFTTLLLGYFLVNWIPLLLADAGLDHDKAIMGVVLLNLGGIIGSIIMSRISDRNGPFKILAVAFGVGAIFVAAVGLMIQSSIVILLSLIFVGNSEYENFVIDWVIISMIVASTIIIFSYKKLK